MLTGAELTAASPGPQTDADALSSLKGSLTPLYDGAPLLRVGMFRGLGPGKCAERLGAPLRLVSGFLPSGETAFKRGLWHLSSNLCIPSTTNKLFLNVTNKISASAA